jgi:hypothetical protein
MVDSDVLRDDHVLESHCAMGEQESTASVITPDQARRFVEDLELLLRGRPDRLNAYLHTLSFHELINQTNTVAHCHCVQVDANGKLRVADFCRYLATLIVDYCIPRSEIAEAKRECDETGSTAKLVALAQKARDLFTALPNSGEGGELLLSTMAETYLHLPQVMTKMSLKTSGQMHVHGSDAIHMGVDAQTGHLTLYWGEAKLRQDMNTAIDKCLEDIAPYLTAAGGSGAPYERDLFLLRDNLDLNDELLEGAIREYLDPDHERHLSLEYRGLCLVGFDCEAYLSMTTHKSVQALRADISSAFARYKQKIEKGVQANLISRVVIEIFCVPFPSVQEFRDGFRREVRMANGQE